jgi:6-carboxyhexanoate--CoA ligase
MKDSFWNIRMRATSGNRHISGAETITGESGIMKLINMYTKRALTHERGEPDHIVISIERLESIPKRIPSLDIRTIDTKSPAEAEAVAERILLSLGISGEAIRTAIRIVRSGMTMRGAALVRTVSGRREDPDQSRGIRASRLGMHEALIGETEEDLKTRGMDPIVVREAVTLASKVASCPGITAELCISDDPSYTTGYLASSTYGYIRLTNIKERGSPSGGRVFFLDEKADKERVIEYLERVPVIVSSPPGIHGIITLDELFSNPDS